LLLLLLPALLLLGLDPPHAARLAASARQHAARLVVRRFIVSLPSVSGR
jgi:hypothetical protein